MREHDVCCVDNCALAGERYGTGRLVSAKRLGPEGAARAEGAVLVKVIEHGRKAHTEHLPADVVQQLGQEDSPDAGKAGVVVGEAGAPGSAAVINMRGRYVLVPPAGAGAARLGYGD